MKLILKRSGFGTFYANETAEASNVLSIWDCIHLVLLYLTGPKSGDAKLFQVLSSCGPGGVSQLTAFGLGHLHITSIN